MAKEPIDWITINGKHVPIYDGESKQDAYNRAVAKHNEEVKEKQIAENKSQVNNKTNTIRDSIPSGFGKNSVAEEKIKDIITDFQKNHADSKSEYGLVISSDGKITNSVGYPACLMV